MHYLRFIFSAFLLGTTTHSLTATELFTGHDFTGWEFVSDPAVNITQLCQVLPGGVISAAGKPVGFIATTAAYKNYRLHVEWRWSGQPGNGGILVHISPGPQDRAWPLSIQIQTKNKNVGDILPMANATFTEVLTTAPGVAPAVKGRIASDSEKPPGEWNVCDIVCSGDTIEVTINGVLQNKISGASPHAGRIGFQFENAPFEIRHAALTLLPE